MNELVAWLKEQNEGVCTYIALQQRAYGLARFNPDQTAVFRLLGTLAARFASSYEGMPLSADPARSAFERMVALVEEAQRAMGGTTQEKLAILNEIAKTELT
jgi:hypothetical protein